MKNIALETTNFDFYGDELITVQDNATGEIYTSINAVLKGIGFKKKDSIPQSSCAMPGTYRNRSEDPYNFRDKD